MVLFFANSVTNSLMYSFSILIVEVGELEKQQWSQDALHLESKLIDTVLLYMKYPPTNGKGELDSPLYPSN